MQKVSESSSLCLLRARRPCKGWSLRLRLAVHALFGVLGDPFHETRRSIDKQYHFNRVSAISR